MTNHIHLRSIVLKCLISLAFAASVFLFYLKLYPGHLAYHEQYQMFLFTKAYAAEVLAMPGGVAEYLSRFTIQFFRVDWMGALWMALMLVAAQWVTWRAMVHRPLWAYPISLAPAIALWAYMCDENAMPTAVFAVTLSLAAAWGVSKVRRSSLRYALVLVGIPVMYMACGPLAVIYPIAAFMRLYASQPTRPGVTGTIICAIAAALCIACPFVAYHIYMQPLWRLATGLHYFRFPMVTPVMPWIAAVVACAVVAVSAWMRPLAAKKALCALVLLIVASAGASAWCVARSADYGKEEVLAYDYLLRTRQWKAIVEKAMAK